MWMRRAVLLLLTVMLSAGLCAAQDDPAFGEVGIDRDWLTVDGEKFLVVGLGYEIGCRPGRVPWDREFRPDLLHADFKRIKAAGFNTLRTWTPMTDEELAIAAEYGLWVIHGVWYDVKADFADRSFQDDTAELVSETVARSVKHPNILYYLLGNEPHGDAVFKAGEHDVQTFHRKLIEAAQAHDPKRPMSYANCVFADFLEPEPWDLVSHNAYPYSPVQIEKTLGYRGYLEMIKRLHAPDRPLIITEFGLSVSPKGDGRGYGGNTIEEQRDGVVALWDEVLNAGAAGGCTFMWIDGWWKAGDENTHSDTSEEWYGLLSADENEIGEPRPVYYALKEYNRAIRTLPRDGSRHAGPVAVEVWSPNADVVEACLDDGPWVALTKEGPWWRSLMDVSSVQKGMHVVHTRMKESGGEWGSEKQANIRLVSEREVDRDPVSVRLISLPKRWRSGKALPVTAVVRNTHGAPVVGRPVSVSRFIHTGWNEFEVTAETDADGRVTVSVPIPAGAGIASIAAAAEGDEPERNELGWKQGPHKRYGEYRHVELLE